MSHDLFGTAVRARQVYKEHAACAKVSKEWFDKIPVSQGGAALLVPRGHFGIL